MAAHPLPPPLGESGAPRPDPETPAPPRFLPEYDNVVLGHADRSRITAGAAGRWPTDDLHWSPLLVDGYVRAVWRLKQDRRSATLVVAPFDPLSAQAIVEEEATRLLEFLAPEAGRGAIELVTG